MNRSLVRSSSRHFQFPDLSGFNCACCCFLQENPRVSNEFLHHFVNEYFMKDVVV